MAVQKPQSALKIANLTPQLLLVLIVSLHVPQHVQQTVSILALAPSAAHFRVCHTARFVLFFARIHIPALRLVLGHVCIHLPETRVVLNWVNLIVSALLCLVLIPSVQLNASLDVILSTMDAVRLPSVTTHRLPKLVILTKMIAEWIDHVQCILQSLNLLYYMCLNFTKSFN